MICPALLLVTLGSSPVMAQAVPAGAPDPRLRAIQYEAAHVVRLNVAMGFQTTIIFEPGEQIENVALGDSSAWQVAPNQRGDHLFIKPLRASGTTNLTVITDARVYSFELASAAGPTADTPFTLRFLYPRAEPQGAPASLSTGNASAPYRLGGSRSLQPDRVSDDGERTYVDWRPDQPVPAVFAIDDHGREILLDGHMRDGRYVIDAVYPTLLFRMDRQTARATRPRSEIRP